MNYSSINHKPFKLQLLIDSTNTVNFELDTGSYVSTLCERDVLCTGASIQPTHEKALAYGGTPIKLIGECFLPGKLGNKEIKHKFLIVILVK